MKKSILLALFVTITIGTQSVAMEFIRKAFKDYPVTSAIVTGVGLGYAVIWVERWSNAPHKNLIQAVHDGDVDAAKVAIKAGGDCLRYSQGSSLLHIAVNNDDSNMLKFLLSQSDINTLINSTDGYGYTPIYYAVINQNKEIAFLLKNAGALIDFIGLSEFTQDYKNQCKKLGLVE